MSLSGRGSEDGSDASSERIESISKVAKLFGDDFEPWQMPRYNEKRSRTMQEAIHHHRIELADSGDPWVVVDVRNNEFCLEIDFFNDFLITANITLSGTFENGKLWPVLMGVNTVNTNPNPSQVRNITGTSFGRDTSYEAETGVESYGDTHLAIYLVRALLGVHKRSNCYGLDHIRYHPTEVVGVTVDLDLTDPDMFTSSDCQNKKSQIRVMFAKTNHFRNEQVQNRFCQGELELSTFHRTTPPEYTIPFLCDGPILRFEPSTSGDDTSEVSEAHKSIESENCADTKCADHGNDQEKATMGDYLLIEDYTFKQSTDGLLDELTAGDGGMYAPEDIQKTILKVDLSKRECKVIDIASVKFTEMSSDNGVAHYKHQIVSLLLPNSYVSEVKTLLFHHANALGLSCWIEEWDPIADALPRWIESIWPTVATFDMDSTLIEEETIDELATVTGRQAEVATITEAAMEGKLDFRVSLCKRLKLFKGIHWNSVKESFVPTITKGAAELIAELRLNGIQMTALVSGGFLTWAGPVAEKLGIDYAIANDIGVEDDRMTGKLTKGSSIIDAAGKAKVLEAMTSHFMQQTRDPSLAYSLAVGDGSNDILMMDAAYPFSVSFNGKKVLRENTNFHVNERDLRLITVMIDASFPPKYNADSHTRIQYKVPNPNVNMNIDTLDL